MSGKPILYYIRPSPPARSVVLLAKHLNLDLDMRTIDLATNEQKTPEFLRLNPMHTVPTLVLTDGQSLWDSHAILTYLADLHAAATGDDSLFPRDLIRRAVVNQRLHFETAYLFPVVADVYLAFVEQGLTEVRQKTRDDAEVAYGYLEAMLARDQTKWLAGNELTVADLSAIPSLSTAARYLPIDAKRYPLVTAWIARFEELPYFQEFNTEWMETSFVVMMEEGRAKNLAAKKADK